MKRRRFDIGATAGEIGSALAEMGCVFEWEADNRGGYTSRYIFVRQPVAAKIRVADHPPNKQWVRAAERAKILMLDVQPRGLTADEAIAEIARLTPAPIGDENGPDRAHRKGIEGRPLRRTG